MAGPFSLLGHSTITLTMDTCAQATPKMKDEVIEKLRSVLFGESAKSAV
jgi:hypothetical protein